MKLIVLGILILWSLFSFNFKASPLRSSKTVQDTSVTVFAHEISHNQPGLNLFIYLTDHSSWSINVSLLIKNHSKDTLVYEISSCNGDVNYPIDTKDTLGLNLRECLVDNPYPEFILPDSSHSNAITLVRYTNKKLHDVKFKIGFHVVKKLNCTRDDFKALRQFEEQMYEMKNVVWSNTVTIK